MHKIESDQYILFSTRCVNREGGIVIQAWKKYLAGLLCFVMIFSFSPPRLLNATEKNVYITTEDGTFIGIESPRLQTQSANKLEKLNVTYRQMDDRTSFLETISVPPSLNPFIIEIPFEFLHEEHLVLYEDGLGKIYNAGTIYSKEDKSIGVVFAHVDKKQEETTVTSYIKDNNILELTVDATKLLKPLQIQVEITASSFSTYFSSEWIYRAGKDTLSLTHKPYLTDSDNMAITSVKIDDAWEKVLATHGSNEKWSNTEGMKNQFDCHFNFAKNKSSWNLEPLRPNVGYFSTVMAACNP